MNTHGGAGSARTAHPGLFDLGTEGATVGELKPTDEQTQIVDAVRRGRNVVIQAGAGTGKTSTLKMAARVLGRRRGVYIAYNKSIATEAAASFPEQVSCRTSHSLAYQAIGRRYRHRLNGPRELPTRRAEILGTRWLDLGSAATAITPTQLARIAVDTVTRFCYSADDEIGPHHVPAQNGIVGADHEMLSREAVVYARRAWADLRDLDGRLKFHYDHFLKMWALTNPRLPFDVVMLDEAQDSNPCVAQLVQSQQHAQQIAVGDSNQSLYQWRGATDALERWEADDLLFLSQSWRFGPVIAGQANRWLAHIGSSLRLKGNPGIASELADLNAPRAVLCRTNAEAMRRVMLLLAQGCRVALAGGGTEIKRLALAAEELQEQGRTSHPELYVFASWGALQEYVETDSAGADLKPFVDLIDSHGTAAVLEAIDALVDERRCNTVVSTAHKSKGREWESVLIADDFPEPLGHNGIPKVDAMLGYVAVTRARLRLDPGGLAWERRHTTPRPAAS